MSESDQEDGGQPGGDEAAAGEGPPLLAFIRANLCAAREITASGCRSEEAGLHLARGWFGIYCLSCRRPGRLPISDYRWLDELARSGMSLPKQLALAEWKNDLLRFLDAWTAFPGVKKEDGVSYDRLLLHLTALQRVFNKTRRRVRKELHIPFLPARLCRVLLTTTLAASALIGGWQLYRGAAPWKLTFYPTRTLSGPPRTVRAEQIDFHWHASAPFEDYPSDDFSIRLETCLRLLAPTKLLFQVSSDDGSRLFIDGMPVLNQWVPQTMQGAREQVALGSGSHLLQIEYFELAGGAELRLDVYRADGRPFPLSRRNLGYPAKDQAGRSFCRE